MIRKISIIFISLLLSSCTLAAVTTPTEQPLPNPTEILGIVDTIVPAAAQAACTTAVCPTCAALVTPLPPTVTNTSVVAPTSTPIPTMTSIPSFTPANSGKKTPTTAPVGKPFIVQPNSPVYLQNFAHADKGCNWMGISGQVFDKTGITVKGLVVVVEGFIGTKAIEGIGMTGLATKYGPGGFEIELSDKAVDTTTSLFITLYDTAGKMLSNPVPFNTFSDCKKNLVLINFQQK